MIVGIVNNHTNIMIVCVGEILAWNTEIILGTI